MERNIFDSVVTDPKEIHLKREQLCDDALDQRELMVVALSTVLKAIVDYRKASADDVDSRNSGMMM